MLAQSADNRKPLRAKVQETPLYVPGKPRPVAGVTGHTLHKYIHSKMHFRRNSPAIGWDADLVRRAQELGATEMLVRDLDTGATYTVSLVRFLLHSFSQDFGHGRQLFLRLEHWRKDGASSPAEVRETALAQKAAIQASRPVQGDLFGSVS